MPEGIGYGKQKRVGDGTGMGSMPPTVQGDSHVGGDEPEAVPAAVKAGGSGHATHDGTHRTSHPHGDKSS